MQTTLKKFGNSRALVIPKAILDLFSIQDNTPFFIRTNGTKIIIESQDKKAEKIEIATQKIDKKYGAVFTALANK